MLKAHKTNPRGSHPRHHHMRGFSIVDLAATLAAATVVCLAAIPLAHAKDDISLRAVSYFNLAELNLVHTTYAADHEDGQFSVIPGDFAQFANVDAYEAANRCIDPLILGVDPNGAVWGYYLGCGTGPGNAGNLPAYKPMDFEQAPFGACRLANTPKINVYANGRYFDPLFFAAEDNALTLADRKLIRNGTDFTYVQATGHLAFTSYVMSPAAMFNPIVMGDGQSAKTALWRNPALASTAGGLGFQSPSVSQCTYPSLKTRLMENTVTENAPSPCNPAYGGCVPYTWYQSAASTNLALFYDGSVDVLSAVEAMEASDATSAGLWLRNTPLGTSDMNSNAGFNNGIGAHFLTKFGIKGRDRLE